jgi:hypothetical protein
MRLRGPTATLLLIVIGLALATSSSLSLPLGFGVAEFWLGIVVVVGGSLWFGGWGVIAAALFPFFSSLLIGLDLPHSLAVIPANLLEGLIPALAFRLTAADPSLHDKASVKIYGIWAVVIPSMVGAFLTAGIWTMLGDVEWRTFALLGFDWAVSNSLVLIVIGFPTLYFLTPILRERSLTITGWWR